MIEMKVGLIGSPKTGFQYYSDEQLFNWSTEIMFNIIIDVFW